MLMADKASVHQLLSTASVDGCHSGTITMQHLAAWLSPQWQLSTNDNSAVAVTSAVSLIMSAANTRYAYVAAAIQSIGCMTL